MGIQNLLAQALVLVAGNRLQLPLAVFGDIVLHLHVEALDQLAIGKLLLHWYGLQVWTAALVAQTCWLRALTLEH